MFHYFNYVCCPTKGIICRSKTNNTYTVKNKPCTHALSPHNVMSGTGCWRCALLERDSASECFRGHYPLKLHGFSAFRESEREWGTSDRGTSCFGYFLVKTHIYLTCPCSYNVILTLWIVNWGIPLIRRWRTEIALR